VVSCLYAGKVYCTCFVIVHFGGTVSLVTLCVTSFFFFLRSDGRYHRKNAKVSEMNPKGHKETNNYHRNIEMQSKPFSNLRRS
jgi:hypothetical protein